MVEEKEAEIEEETEPAQSEQGEMEEIKQEIEELTDKYWDAVDRNALNEADEYQERYNELKSKKAKLITQKASKEMEEKGRVEA